MPSIFEDPVGYWVEAAVAHREYGAKYGRSEEHKRYHEMEAIECERKAAEAAAKHAFA